MTTVAFDNNRMNRRYFFINNGALSVRVDIDEIVCVSAHNENELIIYTISQAHRVLLALSDITSLLPAESFCRVNDNSIIAYDHISKYDEVSVTLTNKMILHCDDMCRKMLHQQLVGSSYKN